MMRPSSGTATALLSGLLGYLGTKGVQLGSDVIGDVADLGDGVTLVFEGIR